MKKFYLLLVAMVIFPMICCGQAKIYTKKVKLSDFPTKTTKIVLTGNELMDSPLKDEIARRWRISPYEFCTTEEYGSIKSNPDYYFLRLVDTNGIFAFALSKESLDVINLPFCQSGNPTGREMIFLPAFIDILQTYVMDSINSDMTGYLGLKDYSKNIFKGGGKTFYLSRDDLAAEYDSKWAAKDIRVLDEDDVDEIFDNETEDAAVSYTVAPAPGVKRARCYVFLIGADTHSLYYYASHKVSSRKMSGFTKGDLNFISAVKTK